MIWVAILGCLLISFIFSGVEAGIFSVNRVRLKHQVKLRDPAALKLEQLLKRPDRLLVTVLIVTNVMNIGAIALMIQILTARFGQYGYWMAAGIFLPLYLLGLELLPKSLFRRFPYRSLAALAEPLRLVDQLLSPIHLLGLGVSRLIAPNKAKDQQKLFVAREEFKYLTIQSERTGTISQDERQMIHNVVDFRAIKAQDVMVPMSEVFCIGMEATVSELLAQSREKRIDRWPVTGEDGRIIGLVTVFDIALEGRQRGRVESFLRRIVKVGPRDPAYTVLRKLRAARSTMAAVVGSDGAALGVVTWEGLIQRLVNTAAVSDAPKKPVQSRA